MLEFLTWRYGDGLLCFIALHMGTLSKRVARQRSRLSCCTWFANVGCLHPRALESRPLFEALQMRLADSYVLHYLLGWVSVVWAVEDWSFAREATHFYCVSWSCFVIPHEDWRFARVLRWATNAIVFLRAALSSTRGPHGVLSWRWGAARLPLWRRVLVWDDHVFPWMRMASSLAM